MSSLAFPPEANSAGMWALTPEELCSLDSTRRLFLLGLVVVAGLGLAAMALTLWGAGRPPGRFGHLALPGVICLALAAVVGWFLRRAWIIGQDIGNGRAEMQWGRVNRVWRRLHVAEVEGCLFPLQVAPVPSLRRGERVWLRFAPRSRITLEVRTLGQVMAAERLAGRSPCPAALAELGKEP